MKYTKILMGIAVMLVASFAMQGAQAACPGVPLLFTSASGIHVEGWPSGGATCYTFGCYEPPFSANASGVFWKLGDGQTNFSGPWTSDNWLNSNSYADLGTYFYFPGGLIATSWNESAAITGCVYDNPAAGPGGECTCFLLSDTDASGNSYAAQMCAQMDGLGNTNFDLAGGAPIVLTKDLAGTPFILNTVRNQTTRNLDAIEVTVQAPASGVYGDVNCPGSGPASYKILGQLLPRGSAAPLPTTPGWAPLALAGGGLQADVPFGNPVTLESMCGASDTDLWLVSQVTFDSGFGTAFLSGNATRVECGINVANPIESKPGRPGARDLAPRGQREGRSGGR
jgi:hypothetical protein